MKAARANRPAMARWRMAKRVQAGGGEKAMSWPRSVR